MRKIKIIWMWLKRRTLKLPQYDTRFWLFMIAGLWVATSVAMIIAGLGNPTGVGLFFDLVIYLIFNVLLFTLSTIFVAFLLSLMYVPIPRLYIGSLLYTGLSVYMILDAANLGLLFSTIIAIAYAIAGIIVGLVIVVLTNRWIKPQQKIIFVLLLASSVCLSFFLWPPADDHVQRAFVDYDDMGEIRPLQVENPAEFGSYSYNDFTYGSGKDRHRKEFGSGTDIRSTSVDASDYIDEWPLPRYLFWGFDEKEIPLNGHVWMPEGEGPFPLVLMVHGNHRMESFSDGGYAYLGELLASRGFIAVSVDQNFLNYSSWSGIPSEDMQLRTWMLLHHLLQIHSFQEQPDTPFYERVDLQQVALIGHSRGGQAAAMAADYTHRFASDSSISSMENINIQAVVGLAPTQRSVEGRQPALTDTYYLTLHGARDADVTNFYGDRQFGRSTYAEGSDRFKASLYIAEANHSQFNTDWGRMDIRLPGGLFLNRNNIMDPSEQREMTKVYISAFLETALHGNDQYIDLFRDYRYGREWLPNTQYFSRFENGMFIGLTDFDNSQDKTTFDHEITVDAKGFSEWNMQEAEDRRGNSKGMKGVVLEWNDTGSYHINVSDSFRHEMLTSKPYSLIFSMANLERDLNGQKEEWGSVPSVEVELESRGGAGKATVSLSLDQFMEVAPPIYTTYTRITWFDEIMREGKYDEATEPIFQTYELPLTSFEQINPNFEPKEITNITFHFNSESPSRVMLADIGFIPF